MFPILMLVLPISVFAVFLVLAGVMLVTAFAGPGGVANTLALNEWQPPAARGDELRRWATARARTIVDDRLSHTADAAPSLSAAIHQGVSYAISRIPVSPVSVGFNDCPARDLAPNGLTAPEALEIAEYMRSRMEPEVVNRIHQKARANNASQTELCPLLTDEGQCMIAPVRPLRCRGWCGRSEMGGDQSAVAKGAETGLRAGLASARLDGNLYEINSALVRALETGNGSRRWIGGEESIQGLRDL